MSENKKITLWKYVVAATWLCWSSSIYGGRSSCACSSALDDNLHIAATKYDTINFNLRSATPQSFKQFISQLRCSLRKYGDIQVHSIRTLSPGSSLHVTQRFVIVQLSHSEAASIELAIDVCNVNIVGYRAAHKSYFFSDAPPEAFYHVFKGTSGHKLGFGSGYADLEHAAQVESRNATLIGAKSLLDAIGSMSNTDNTPQTTLAKNLIVIIQMISEAARFNYIEARVRQRMDLDDFKPDDTMLSLENNWASLSRAVQESNDGGVFATQILLQTTHFTRRLEGNVADLKNALALMLFVCRRPPSQYSPLTGSVATNSLREAVCQIPEPTVRISGRNGLCVDVKNEKYNDGNPIQLYRCKSNQDVNQLWTLKEDGTIQSNGKCLKASTLAQPQYATIHDCRRAEPSTIYWQVWANGTIVNTKSGYVLTASAGTSGTTLTIEENTYASSQAWLASNNTDPLVASILGLGDRCLQSSGDNVWVEKCSGARNQQWALYADGSIRLNADRSSCLTCDNRAQGSVVKISSCSPASSGQRWMFKNDGTIMNLHYGLVLDVKGSDPGRREIIIWRYHGNANQMWLAMP